MQQGYIHNIIDELGYIQIMIDDLGFMVLNY